MQSRHGSPRMVLVTNIDEYKRWRRVTIVVIIVFGLTQICAALLSSVGYRLYFYNVTNQSSQVLFRADLDSG